MFNTKVFPSFEATRNTTKRDKQFLNVLVEARRNTTAEYVCFSLFDFGQANSNLENFVTYPIEWISHYLTSFNGDMDPLVSTDYRRSVVCDWDDVRGDGRRVRLLDSIRTHGLGSNGLCISHPIGGCRYGVLSLCFHVEGSDWPLFKAKLMPVFKQQAAIATADHTKIYHPDPVLDLHVTQRELQVLRSIALGKTDQQIADQLGVGKWTVVSTFKRIRQKLNSPNRAATVATALTKGIIQI